MELAHLIEALADPSAYHHSVERVEVRHTHISVVFLAGPFAYKVKKPINLGFLDFTTVERRRHFCEEEVRLNRRLAPQVYLGIVPVTRTALGLAVAIPAVLGYNALLRGNKFILTKLNRFAHDLHAYFVTGARVGNQRGGQVLPLHAAS